MSKRPPRQPRRQSLAAFASSMVPTLMPTLKKLLAQHGRENTAFLVQPHQENAQDYSCDVCNRDDMIQSYRQDYPEIAAALDHAAHTPVLLLDRDHWFCFTVS